MLSDKFEKMIGRGACGEVWKVSKKGKFYAIKFLPENSDTSDVEEEIAKGIQFTNPFLVKYYFTFRFLVVSTKYFF
jgi:hypothetical protein